MKKGFTLIELLGVILIMAIILIIAIPNYLSSKATATNALNDLEKKNIIEAAKSYKLSYPYMDSINIEGLVQSGYLNDLNRKCSNDEIDISNIENINVDHIVCTDEEPDPRHQASYGK